MPRLAGKVAFITGAGTGIGRATAILFAREGARVAIAEIDARAGQETAQLAGNEAIAIQADVTDPRQSAVGDPRHGRQVRPPRHSPQQCWRLDRTGRYRGKRPAR